MWKIFSLILVPIALFASLSRQSLGTRTKGLLCAEASPTNGSAKGRALDENNSYWTNFGYIRIAATNSVRAFAISYLHDK